VKVKYILKLVMLCAVLVFSQYAFAMQSYGPTKTNETLWTIASHHHPAKTTIEQVALAIVKLNPKAFVGPDYVLKPRQYLRLPSNSAEIKQALGNVSLQHQAKAKTGPKSKSQAKLIPIKLRKPDEHKAKKPIVAPVKHYEHPLEAALTHPQSNELAAAQAQINQLNQQLAAANQQVASLQQQLDGSGNSFPWASLWFILWALTAISFYIMFRHFRSNNKSVNAPTVDLKHTRAEKTEPIIISVSEKPTETPFEQCELDISTGAEDSELQSNEVGEIAEEDEDELEAEAMQATPEIEALLQEIETDPYNLDLRMELLELYAEAGDKKGFDAQSRDMLKHNLMIEGDEIWARVRAMYLDAWVYS